MVWPSLKVDERGPGDVVGGVTAETEVGINKRNEENVGGMSTILLDYVG